MAGGKSRQVSEFITSEIWPWWVATLLTREAGKPNYNTPFPEHLDERWEEFRRQLIDLRWIKEAHYPVRVKTWGNLNPVLTRLNEEAFLSSGYYLTSDGAVLLVDRHRVERFLGVPYHLIEGRAIRYNDTPSAAAIGLTAMVPQESVESVMVYIDQSIRELKLAGATLTDGVLKGLEFIQTEMKPAAFSEEDYELIRSVVPKAIKAVEQAKPETRRQELYRQARMEERFHVRQTIAAARLSKEHPLEIEPRNLFD